MLDWLKTHRHELVAAGVTLAIIYGLIFGGMWISSMGPVAMVVGFGMLVAGSAIGVAMPLLW